jgi:putative nucleotidyltransferase with HDIG domain
MMISQENLNEIKHWFTEYVRQYIHDGPENRNIVLKEEHTYRVCDEILNLGGELGFKDDALRLAEICALLHDVGRFEQYDRYHTFSDCKSENHASLGIRILKKHDVLKKFDAMSKALIFRTIECHNHVSLPAYERYPHLLFIKLLRDADKLDIYRVVTDYYHRNDPQKNEAIELDLPDTPGISKKVYQDLICGKTVHSNELMNLNDFKLLQIGWIFDINFSQTLRRIQSRQYLEMIRSVLPETDEIHDIFNRIQAYLNQQLFIQSA